MTKKTLTTRLRCRAVLAAAALGYIACGTAAPASAAEAAPAAAVHGTHQQHFATPEAAVQALVAALRSDDTQRIHRVLGPGSSKLIRSGDTVADDQARDRFIAAFEQRWKIEPDGDAKATLLLGDKEWPLPFPLLKAHGRWTFDARSGAEEVLNRRIGRNELGAIQACLAYVDAQREYALTDGNSDGVHDYAMALASTPGKRDGLYWPTGDGEPPSPLGALVARAKAEGYGSGLAAPYHGYFYKVLSGQGKDAPGGAYDYVVNGQMMGGFALLAYPARWGASGVMSFVVNHDGVVFQANLGRNTAAFAAKITRFNPDSSWTKVHQ